MASVQFLSCSNNPDKNSENDTLVSTDALSHISDSINTLYNYSSNHQPHKLTYLEFGSIGCTSCKRMEYVIDSVKAAYNLSVNVVMFDVRDKKNKAMVNYYGINLIPVQILLDSNGNEYFRHIGYFSYDSLAPRLNEHLNL